MGMYIENGTTWEDRAERDRVLTAGHFHDACNHWQEGEPAPCPLDSALAVGCLTENLEAAIKEARDDVYFWLSLKAGLNPFREGSPA